MPEGTEEPMKKQRHAPAPRLASPDVLEKRGAEDLEQGRFKEAVEAFRQLVKVEPRPEWQRSLVRAYAGRGRALAAKGMYREAPLLFDNAIGVDGAFHEPLIHLACLVRTGDTEKAARLCARMLDEAATGITSEERGRIADLAAALWLAGNAPPASPAPVSKDPISPTDGERSPSRVLGAAEKALTAWCGGAPAEEVDALLSAIPLRSPFKPLRLILKSLVSTGDDTERRTRLLDMVPPDSAFGALARAARVAVSGDTLRTLAEWGSLKGAARTFVAEAGGQSADGAKLLTELVEAERRGPDLLLDALLKHAGRFPAEELRAACLNLLPLAPRRIAKFERQFGPLSSLEHHRIQALAAEQAMHWDNFEDHWNQYARELEGSDDPDAALSRSVIYRHMADTAVKALGIRPRAGDDPVADLLEKSVEADPDDRDGVLKLLARLREGGQTKARDRWAELAAARFPDDPAILTEALEAAAQRGAFRKAAEFAGKLLKVDPINPLARQRLIELRIAHARKKLVEGRVDLAGKELAQAARHERRDAPDGALMIVRGLVAVRAGRLEEGWADVRAGVARLGGGVPGWLRAVLEAQALGFQNKDIKPATGELTSAQSADPTTSAVVAALGVLNRREFREDRKLSADGLKAIRHWLKRGAGCALSDAEFQTVAETLERLKAFDLLRAYAEGVFRRGSGRSLAEFYWIVANAKGDANRLTPFDGDRLEDIISGALERKDLHLAYKVMDFLDQGMPPMPFDDLDVDDFLDLPPPGGFSTGSPFDDLFGNPFAGVDAQANEIEVVVARASELLRRHSRSEVIDILMKEYGKNPMVNSLPKGLVRALFDMVVDAAMGAGPAAGKRGTAPRRKRGRR
jgi:tetratricopeptide (TPR) repeat protein